MHIWTSLFARESALLGVLLALGAAPASFLSERFDATARIALAPVLGFCLGTCIATTVLEFAPAGDSYWMLIPLAMLSLGIAAQRTIATRRPAPWRTRLPLQDVLQLLVVCVAVTGPLNYTLHSHHTVGPAAFTYTDVDNYVAEEDGAQTTSITHARDLWKRAQTTGARFADLTQSDWAFFASFNANPNAAPLDANVDGLLGLGATDTNSSFLVVLLLVGALGLFATVRYATRSSSWIAVLAGALVGGPLYVELWFDTFQAALIALGLVMPMMILGNEVLRTRRIADVVILGLILACLLTVYPVLVPIAIVTGAVVLTWHFFRLRHNKASLRELIRPFTLRIGAFVVALGVFANVGIAHAFSYYLKLINNEVPLPRVPWHLPPEVLPGWLLQTREFWYMPSLGVGGLKQLLLGALIPIVFLSVMGIAVRRHRFALALAALGGVCLVIAEYAYSSRNACTYCAERDLLPLAPIAIVLLAVGLIAMLAMPQRIVRIAALAVVALAMFAVGERSRIELTRFTNGSYFLDSANRSVLSQLPRNARAVQLEGFGQTLNAQAEQPLVYHLTNEHARGRVSIVLGSDVNNAIEYLDFGVIKTPGPEFHADYDYVLTRFAGIHSDRTVVARSGAIALEKRTQQLDILPYSGLGAPLARLDRGGTAWVQPQLPLQLYLVGDSSSAAWAKLTFRVGEPVSVPPQRGVRAALRGTTLTVCVRATGAPPARSLSLQLSAPAIGGPVGSEQFPAPAPLEGIALSAMHVVRSRCSV